LFLRCSTSIADTVRQIKNSINLGVQSQLTTAGDITWNDIITAAHEGDALCLKGIEKLVHYISIGLVNVVNTFDPEVVFLGHEIALADELVTRPLQNIVNMNTFFRSSKQVGIELSKFKDYAPCIGAPAIVLEKFFNGEI